MLYHLRTVFGDSGAHIVTIAPVPQYENEPTELARQNYSNKADDAAQPSSGQHASRVLGIRLPED